MQKHKVYAKELPTKERKQIWDQIVADFAGSKIKPAEYCRMHGLNAHSLSYQRLKRNRIKPAASPAFIPVTVSTPNTDTNWFALSLPNGIQIKMESNFSESGLEKILTVASKIKC